MKRIQGNSNRFGSKSTKLNRRIGRRAFFESLENRNLMASDTTSGVGLLGQYYNNADFTDLALSRTDSNIAFNWSAGSPDALLGPDSFSARWSGMVEAVYTEEYSFIVNADNAVRLWVNGQLLIDRWNESAVVNATGKVNLVSGRKYDVLIEYYEDTGNASIQWEWSSLSQIRETVPTIRLFPSERGNILREVWSNVVGTSISSLTSAATFPASPSFVSLSNSLEAPSNQSDNFGERMRGLLHAPKTGDYTFYLSGNETAELWLSNSAEALGKQRISTVPSPTLVNEWTKFPEQRSVVLKLVAGQSYYLEVLHKESVGVDHVAVAWTLPGSAIIELIGGEHLSPVLAEVSLFAERPTTAEGSQDSAQLKVVRSGIPNTNSLTVFYSLRGSAVNGTDIAGLSGSVIIPSGQDTVSINIQPLSDALVEGSEKLILELKDGPGYQVGRLSERTATVTIQDNSPAPVGGVPLLSGTALVNFVRFGGVFSSLTDPLLGPVIQAVISTAPSNPWDAQLNQAISTPVIAGDILYAEFFVRSVTATGNITAIFEQSATFDKSLSRALSVSTSWTKVQLPFIAKGDYAAGGATFGFHLGSQVQTLQFAQFNVRNYGPSSNLAPNGLNLNQSGVYGTMESVSVSGQPFSSAYSIATTSTPATGQSWLFQAFVQNAVPIQTGDTLQVEFWARALSGANPRLDVVVQESFGTFSVLSANTRFLNASWQKFTFNIAIASPYTAQRLQVALNAGFAPQSIQVGGFTWKNLTRGIEFSTLPDQASTASYIGRTGTDPWRVDADNRINQNRASQLTVQVLDSTGKTVDGAVVNIRQKKHAFKFGSAISGYSNLLAANGSPQSLKYQSEIKRLFNTVVIENNLKWPDFLANRQLGIDAGNWAIANGLTLRGHNVIWPSRSFMPASVWSQYDTLGPGTAAATNYLRTTINNRVIDAADTFEGKVWEWDIVNEPFSNKDAMNVLGEAELLEWFRLFRVHDPLARRTLNDYDIFARNGANTSHRANFDSWLTRLKAQNLIETLGEQSHYAESNLTDIAVLGQLIQSYTTTFGLPIAITEFDITSQDQQLQADYLRDYLTMAYSQSGVSEFNHWGFWNDVHYQPGAALYNSDFSIRPNGQVYEDLVFGDWWTDSRGTTRGGEFISNLFKGDYEVTVTVGGQSLTKALTQFNSNGSLAFTMPGLQTIVPLYQYPLSAPSVLSPWWQQVFVGATTSTPITVIANPRNGPIATNDADFANWITALTLLRQNPNIRIIGYVSTIVAPGSSVVRSSADILGNVNLYSTSYRNASTGASLIDGIFLDEMSTSVSNVATYSSVASGIRANSGLAGRFIVGNPGTEVPIEYVDQNTADAFLVREGTPSNLLNNPTPSYVSSPVYSKFGFGAIVHGAMGTSVLAQMLREIKYRGYDYAFVTDDSGTNPFDVAPSYFNDFLRDIHAPYVLTASFGLAENTVDGTVVGIPFAGDPDAGQSLTFAITGGNTNGAFSIEPKTGRLRVNNATALDFESTPSFQLSVRATDDGIPSLSDTAIVTINLTNVNEQPTISSIGNQTTATNSSVGPIGFTISDPETPASALVVTAISSNSSLIPAGNLILGGNGANRTIVLNPVANTTGTSTITLTVSDGVLTSNTSFLLTVIPVPQVESVVFGDGTLHRSMVKRVEVTFNSIVTIDSDAFQLDRSINGVFETIPTANIAIAVATLVQGNKSIATLTFTGDEVIGGSLVDGNYRLTLVSTKIRSNGLQLDGDGNGVSGGDFVRGTVATDNFFRLFGDFDGNRLVNGLDVARFRIANGTSLGDPSFNPIFDFDGNNVINGIDLARFRIRNGTILTF